MHAHVSPHGLSNLATINLEIYKHREIEKAEFFFLGTLVTGLGGFLFVFRWNIDLLRKNENELLSLGGAQRQRNRELMFLKFQSWTTKVALQIKSLQPELDSWEPHSGREQTEPYKWSSDTHRCCVCLCTHTACVIKI